MATKIISMTYQLKRGSESAIEAANPILASGEPIVVFCPNNITKIKVGDGTTPYKLLPFVGGTVSYDGDGDIVNVVVDSELSTTSVNPVENRVVTAALNTKANKSDLVNFASKSDLENFVDISALADKANRTELDAKVDKVAGKSLSTNDFTDEEKVKLASLEKINIDNTIDPMSFNPVSNIAIATAFSNINNKIDNLVLDGGEII